MPALQNVEHWLSLEDEPAEYDADWHTSSAQVRPSKEVQEVQWKQDDICAEAALVEKERSTPQDGEAKADVAEGMDNPVGLLYPVSIYSVVCVLQSRVQIFCFGQPLFCNSPNSQKGELSQVL